MLEIRWVVLDETLRIKSIISGGLKGPKARRYLGVFTGVVLGLLFASFLSFPEQNR